MVPRSSGGLDWRRCGDRLTTTGLVAQTEKSIHAFDDQDPDPDAQQTTTRRWRDQVRLLLRNRKNGSGRTR
jgi:hypothetical protein